MEIQQTGKLHLLWIAIDRYRHKFWPALSNAVSGSEELEGALHDKFGLTSTRTIALENRQATLAEIEKCLRSFGPGGANELSDDDQLIISFAGHGERDQLTGETAFIPFEADPDSTSTWFRFDHLRPLLRVINARHILVISDSCFSGGVFRSAVSNEQRDNDAAYARRAYIKNSRQMISSGGVEKISDGGARPGKSVFLEGLLHGLRTAEPGWMLADQLFRETRNFVVANADQTPEFGSLNRSGHGGGEFLLFSSEKIPSLVKEDAPLQDNVDSVLADSFVDTSPHEDAALPLSSTRKQALEPEAVVSSDGERLVSVDQDEGSSAETNREQETDLSETIQTVAKSWSARKAEVQSRFGTSFELVDAIDIQRFWQIVDDRPLNQPEQVELVPKKGVSLTSTLFLVVYVHLVFLSFNLWVSDFLTIGTALYPMMVLIPLFHLVHKNYRAAFVGFTTIFASFFLILAFSGAWLERMLGVRPDISVIGASSSLIKVSLALELFTALFLSTVFFAWFRRLTPFVRLFLATSGAMFFATGVYYFTGFGGRFDVLGSSATRYDELVPLLGFGTPVEKHINWFVRDSILYLIISVFSAGVIVFLAKRRRKLDD